LCVNHKMCINCADEPTSGPDVTNIDAHIQDYVISNNNRWRDVPNDWTALIGGVFQPSGFVCEKGSAIHIRSRVVQVQLTLLS